MTLDLLLCCTRDIPHHIEHYTMGNIESLPTSFAQPISWIYSGLLHTLQEQRPPPLVLTTVIDFNMSSFLR